MRIAIFTEGTILMPGDAAGRARDEIVRQVRSKEPSVRDYASYVPVEDAPAKIRKWARQGAEMIYMTSRREMKEVDEIQNVLDRNGFPSGALEHRKGNEEYKDVAERIMPDVLIEDDCESIGGEREMTYPHLSQGSKERIKSIIVKEFSGIGRLPDDSNALAA